MLQAVVSPGPNPLPVATHVKSDQKFGSVFYFLDQETWYANHIESALYKDAVQEVVHTVIQRSLIKTFGSFTWKLDQDDGKYFPKLALPHQGCIYKVIDAVKKDISRHNLEYMDDTEKIEQTGANVDGRNNVADRLPHIWACISLGFLARLLLNLTSTFAVCKNWNSHGANSWGCIVPIRFSTWFIGIWSCRASHRHGVPASDPFGECIDRTKTWPL